MDKFSRINFSILISIILLFIVSLPMVYCSEKINVNIEALSGIQTRSRSASAIADVKRAISDPGQAPVRSLRNLIQFMKNKEVLKTFRKELTGLNEGKRKKRSLNGARNTMRKIKKNTDEYEIESEFYCSTLFAKYGNEDYLSLDSLNDLLRNIGLETMVEKVGVDEGGHSEGHEHKGHDHEGHDHDHEGHDHDHEGHDHEDHDHDYEGDDHDHEGHDHDHESHDHDHEGHDHEGHDEDHEGHNHEGHDDDHEDHDHESHDHDHEGHDHDHEGHHHRMKRDAPDEDKTHNVQDLDVEDENDNSTEELGEQCLTSTQLLSDYEFDQEMELSHYHFLYLCPALIYQLDSGACKSQDHKHNQKEQKSQHHIGLVWLYTMLSVLVISLCALFGILCIPKRDQSHQNPILQFLIALAFGTMSGDGLLHLIPHSMTPHDEEDKDHSQHLDNLYKGLMVLIGVYGFLFIERTFTILRERRSRKSSWGRPGTQHPMLDHGSRYPNGPDTQTGMDNSHGHSHEGMLSCTSLAAMIIIGDMFHNFCDGLAIGAAFAGSMSVGLSTSLAVFCHELPHEIGDFAVLITSGMSRKRAIAFNLLSTVPCFIGAAIGLQVGSFGDASLWIFALVGGMFLYISLADLLPEMTKAYANMSGSWVRCLVLQGLGSILGVLIMLILGIFEDDLQQLLDW